MSKEPKKNDIKPKKPKRAPQAQIDEFKQDVDILDLPHQKVGEKMGLEKGNFSHYYNEDYTITANFLKKFYAAWRLEIQGKKHNEVKSYNTNPGPDSLVQAPVIPYARRDYKTEYIDSLKTNNKALLDNLNIIVSNNTQAIRTNEKLAENNRIIVETNKALVEVHISAIISLLGKSTE